MLNWIVDARNIRDEDAFDDNLMLRTNPINHFLNDKKDTLFFVMATKGLGKTFVLKAKSIYYTRDGIPLIHDNMLVDKPGAGVTIFRKEKIRIFESLQNWINLWTASICLSIIKKLNLPQANFKGASEVLQKILCLPASRITDYCKVLLGLSIPDFYTIIQDDLNSFLLPIIDSVNTPLAAFIDNVDEYFQIHIDPQRYTGATIEGPISSSIWYISQIGLIHAIYHITGKNAHLKIFAAIRKEAFLKMIAEDAMAIQFEGSSIDLTYSIKELKQIFILNIKREPLDNLCYKELLDSDPILAFVGINHIEHTRVGEEEDIFTYIVRHTLLRPRDFMLIGKKISLIDPEERTADKIREIVNNASTEIAKTYINEVQPHIETINWDKLFKLINKNILTLDELRKICSRYNDNRACNLKNCVSCNKSHVFCILHMLGLLGVANESTYTNEIKQTFEMAGIKPLESKGRLQRKSQAKLFVIHPSLNDLILKVNPAYSLNTTNIVGYGYNIDNYLKWHRHNIVIHGHDCRLHELPELVEGEHIHVHFGAGKLGLGLVVPILNGQTRLILIQRNSPKWSALNTLEDIELIVKNNPPIRFDIVHEDNENAAIDYFLDKWKSNNNLLIISNNDLTYITALKHCESISTALGNNLSDIIPILRSYSFKKDINLYPFENDRKNVQKLQDGLESKFINIIPVIADRICSERVIDKSSHILNVEAEEFYEVVLLNKNKDVERLFGRIPNIRLTNSEDEQDFFYKRKFYIVNGIHMIMAIFSYGYLLKKAILFEDWPEYALSVLVDAFDQKRSKILSFISLQSLRLICETPEATLREIFPDSNINQIFNELCRYGASVLARVERIPDKVSRVLNLKDSPYLTQKYKDRIQKLVRFISDIDTCIGRIEDINGISSKKMALLQNVIDLQQHANMIFLKVLEAQQLGALDRQSATLLGGK